VEKEPAIRFADRKLLAFSFLLSILPSIMKLL